MSAQKSQFLSLKGDVCEKVGRSYCWFCIATFILTNVKFHIDEHSITYLEDLPPNLFIKLQLSWNATLDLVYYGLYICGHTI